MEESKKIYHQEYHRQNYVKKKNFCDICGKDLTGRRLKRCRECKISCTCEDCGSIFYRRVHYKKCSKCSYKDIKSKNSEGYQIYRERVRVAYNKKIRESQGLPDNHDFGKAPKGSGYVNVKGYRKFWMKDTESGKQISRYEHHIIMEKKIGRELYDHERVHHINGIRDDNRPENLELWSTWQPYGQRVEDKIKHYIDFLSKYGYRVDKQDS